MDGSLLRFLLSRSYDDFEIMKIVTKNVIKRNVP